jgi:DNA-binding transcriptional LysR family regulator
MHFVQRLHRPGLKSIAIPLITHHSPMTAFDLTRFDLNLLVVLDALLKERHVGRAARRLHLSQSAVSHALARLRRTRRDPLFLRHPRGIEPTPFALELQPRVAAVLREIGELASPRSPLDPRHLDGAFRIGATDHAILSVLAAALGEITKLAPRLVARMSFIDQDSLVSNLDAASLDLAVGSVSFMSLPQRIEALPLFTESFVGIARRGHPALHRRGKGFGMDLDAFCKARHVLVSLRGDAHGAVDVELERLGRGRQITATCPSFMAVPFLVGRSDLVSVLARRVALPLAGAAGMVTFELPFHMAPWTMSLVRARARAAEPSIAWLSDTIKAVTRE